MNCSNNKGVATALLLVIVLVLVGCSRGPIGSEARLGPPSSLQETRMALQSGVRPSSPNCLRNTTKQSLQFELQTGSAMSDDSDDWQRWILPPGRMLHLGLHTRAEIRFVSVPVISTATIPGNSGALVHYQLDLAPPVRHDLPSRTCLHEFRPRPNGMLDLFLNSAILG